MLGSVISRCRVIALVLAFALGFPGQALSGMAMAGQMQPPAMSAATPGDACPGCASEQQGDMATGCTLAACWTLPALPAQGKTPQLQPPVAFTPFASAIIRGIRITPEPPPPRPVLHA
jgi:hypothetical protein